MCILSDLLPLNMVVHNMVNYKSKVQLILRTKQLAILENGQIFLYYIWKFYIYVSSSKLQNKNIWHTIAVKYWMWTNSHISSNIIPESSSEQNNAKFYIWYYIKVLNSQQITKPQLRKYSRVMF